MRIDVSQKGEGNKMRFIIALAVVASWNAATAAEDVVRFALGDPAECKVVSGEVTLEHSSDGYKSPGTVALSDLRMSSERGRYLSSRGAALVAVGPEFQVVPGASYYLSAWIKAQGKRGWDSRTQSRAILTWYDDARKKLDRLTTPWSFGDYDWLEHSNAGVAPANAVVAQVFLEAKISSYGPMSPTWRPTTFLYNDVTVSRTPTIVFTTGKRCNLVFEGEPLSFEISVEDIPAGFGDTVLEGVLLDYWRTPIDRFELELRGQPLRVIHTVPAPNRGYYSVDWTLSRDGEPLRKDLVSVSVIPPPPPPAEDAYSPFALDAGLSVPQDGNAELTLRNGTYMSHCAGVRILRERKGPLAASAFIRSQDIDTYHGLWDNFLNCLRNSGPDDRSSGKLHLREVYDSAKGLVEKHGNLTRYWEVWNEVDAFFFLGRPEEYAAVQKAAYLGAHAGGEDIRVLNASLSETVGPWQEDLFRNGLADYYDILNVHFYDFDDPLWDTPVGVMGRLGRLQDVLQRCEVPPKESWMTEMGYPVEKNEDGTWWRSEQYQAVHVVQGTCSSLAAGIDRFFYFYLQEYFEHGWFMWGIVRRNWTPKPAYTAFANMTYELGKGQFLGDFDLGVPDSYGFVFESGAGVVLVAWAEVEQKVELPGVNLAAVDIMGAPTTAGKISTYPIYVRGLDLTSPRFRRRPRTRPSYSVPDIENLSTFLSLRAVTDEDVSLDPNSWSSKRKEPLTIGLDQKVALELKVCNFSNTATSVTLEWKIPAGWEFAVDKVADFDADPWSENDLRIELIPRDVESGSFYPIEVTGTAPGRKITPAYLRVEFR